jgi:hypothetical protein
MGYPKIIERPYKVYYGEQEYKFSYDAGTLVKTEIDWTYDKSFHLESDANAYAERISEEYEFVKIEKKENN